MTFHETQKQHIDLSTTTFTGKVLDIGGGGEGIIARIGGSNVLAIDRRADELAESPDVGWKVVMDACQLNFIDDYFDNATFFYSLMYMNLQVAEQALKEVWRVLKPGASLWIWDAVIPEEKTADGFLAHLSVKLSATETVNTSYGAGWHKGQSLDSVRQLCEQAGFTYCNGNTDTEAFSLQCKKYGKKIGSLPIKINSGKGYQP